MRTALHILQAFVEGGMALVLCYFLAWGSARDYLAHVASHGRQKLLQLYKRTYFSALFLGTLYFGWITVKGGSAVELVSGAIGFLVGVAVAMRQQSIGFLARRMVVVGMLLIALDCVLEGLPASLAASVVYGGTVALVVAAAALVLGATTRFLPVRGRLWLLRAPFIASLLLVAANPALVLVVAAGVLYGFKSQTLQRAATQESYDRTFLVAVLVIACAHATFAAYSSFMASYGAFPSAALAVSPYAFVSMAIGFSLRMIDVASWPMRTSKAQ